MGFNRRKLQDQRRGAAEMEAATQRAIVASGKIIHTKPILFSRAGGHHQSTSGAFFNKQSLTATSGNALHAASARAAPMPDVRRARPQIKCGA
jgi:hypothetical protein